MFLATVEPILEDKVNLFIIAIIPNPSNATPTNVPITIPAIAPADNVD